MAVKLRQYNITGMSCAACSARVEKAVKAVKGADGVAVNLLTGSMSVSGSVSDEAVIKAVTAAGYGCSVKDGEFKIDDTETPRMARRLIVSAAISAVLMYFCLSGISDSMPGAKYIQAALALAVMLINRKYYVNGAKGVIHGAPNMDTLVGLGSIASFIYGYYDSAAMILTLIDVGKTLESHSKGRTTNAIRSLMKLVPQVDIKVGEEFEVRPGESIPADGYVTVGVSAVDESALTGESIPVDKEAGDAVHAGTINKSGYLKCTATKVGGDTALGQIIKMVSDASSTKAPIAKTADRVAGVFVPVVIGIAAVTFIIWMLTGAKTGFALSRAISVLVISCPCALGLATPVAIMVGSGKGAKNGILFKTAVSLERTGEVTVCALDKTGTITGGRPVVTDVIPIGAGSCGMCPDCTGIGTCENYGNNSEEALLAIAYALEVKSEHPIAKAIVEKVTGVSEAGDAETGTGNRTADDPEKLTGGRAADDFRALTGSGVEGMLDGSKLYGGSRKFIETVAALDTKASVSCDALAEQGKTPVLFVKDGNLIGIIAVADAIKEDSAEAVAQLKKQGMKVVMITGDNEKTAAYIGKQAGVDEVIAGVMPDRKAEAIAGLKKQGRVMMVGDGINDAPALTTADIGIAIGAGTDVAIDAADVVLMKGSLKDVAAAVRLSRRVIRNIRQNLFWAFFYNAIGIPLAAGAWYPLTGWELNPMFCAAAMSVSSIFVVGNALRLNLVDVYDASKDRPLSEKRQRKIAREIAKAGAGADTDRKTAAETAGPVRSKEKNTTVMDCCAADAGSDGIRECREYDTMEEKKMFKTTIEVKGMMCPMCEKHTNEAIEKSFAVESVKSSHDDNETVIISTEKLDEAKLAAVIKEAGYQPGAVTVIEE